MATKKNTTRPPLAGHPAGNKLPNPKSTKSNPYANKATKAAGGKKK